MVMCGEKSVSDVSAFDVSVGGMSAVACQCVTSVSDMSVVTCQQ